MCQIRIVTTLVMMLITPLLVAQQPQDARNEQEALQQDAIDSQTRVESLDDETMSMVSDYNREMQRYEELLSYNENMRQLLESQRLEREQLNAELQEVEVVRQAIVPLMVEMVEVLERFVNLDQPMLLEERSARVEQLKSIVNRSDVDIAEKYRRIIEAYLIEAEYGQSIEAYEGPVTVNGNEITVEFLRLGKVALFYSSLYRQTAAIWNPASNDWTALPASSLEALEYAFQIARDQAPPNLMVLPIWTEEGGL
jgi:hypothetical protein